MGFVTMRYDLPVNWYRCFIFAQLFPFAIAPSMHAGAIGVSQARLPA
jgi:hypothetical protein